MTESAAIERNEKGRRFVGGYETLLFDTLPEMPFV